jgi:hypothetical protein
MPPKGKARAWTEAEDELIRSMVHEHGESKWSLVSDELDRQLGSKRSGKQARSRWPALSSTVSKASPVAGRNERHNRRMRT